MKITAENYYSNEVNKEYASYSQFISTMGALGHKGCEAKAIATLDGLYHEEPTTAMLIGSYVDSYFEGTLAKFKADTPDIFTQKGDLRATYKKGAETMIERAERDELFMKYLSGEKQTIMTAELYGIKWKCKIDSLIKDTAIVDLKTTRDMHSSLYTEDWGRLDFIRFWGYDVQGALYQKIVEENTGKKLPFYIAGIEKPTTTKDTDLEIIGFNQQDLDDALSLLEAEVERFKQLRAREIEPDRCEECNHCKGTKILKKPIHFSELI